MDWFTILFEFQTLIVGVIGFTGVIITLVLNASYARNQREEERNHERQTLRAALFQELTINRESVELNADRLDDTEEGQGVLVPTHAMDDAYSAFIDRIGLLSRDEVASTMNAYLAMRTFRAKLFLFGVPAEDSAQHVNVPPENIRLLAAAFRSLIEPIDRARNALRMVSNN